MAIAWGHGQTLVDQPRRHRLPAYRGRLKSFPIQRDRPFLIVWCYVERKPLRVRANLVDRAEDWLVRPPRNWKALVNCPATEAELDALRGSVARGAPYGEPSWQRRTAARLKLESGLRPPWRPKRNNHARDK